MFISICKLSETRNYFAGDFPESEWVLSSIPLGWQFCSLLESECLCDLGVHGTVVCAGVIAKSLVN